MQKRLQLESSTGTCKNSKYLKNIAGPSLITCDKIISDVGIVSTKTTNTVTTNMSINSNDKKVRYKVDCYILHTVLLVIILLLIITMIRFHHAKYTSKQKSINNIKLKIMNFKKFV